MAKNDVRSDIKDIVESGELAGTAEIGGGVGENQIVVYQPNETVRLEVRLENETVWLTQAQLCALFGVVKSNVSYHLKNIFGTRELDYGATVQKIRTVRLESGRRVARDIEYFNLDVIISLGYRINSKLGIQFRQWATRVLKEFLLRGYSVNSRLNQLEDKMDRRLAKHDDDIAELKDKVDFFVQTQTPPLQGVFYNGQLWDARVFVERLIGSAKRTLRWIQARFAASRSRRLPQPSARRTRSVATTILPLRGHSSCGIIQGKKCWHVPRAHRGQRRFPQCEAPLQGACTAFYADRPGRFFPLPAHIRMVEERWRQREAVCRFQEFRRGSH